MVYVNATALTTHNVSKVLKGVDWKRVCGILLISDDKREELAASFPNTGQRREEAIKFWITSDPLASWRRLVDGLYGLGGLSGHKHLLPIADGLRHCCEKLTGMCIFTTQHHE